MSLSYDDVNNSPVAYYKDPITWTCNLEIVYGQDTGDGNTNLGCDEFTGTYTGLGDGEVILAVPPSIDASGFNRGDDLVVRGLVGKEYVGVPKRVLTRIGNMVAPGAESRCPTIDVTYVTDYGLDPHA